MSDIKQDKELDALLGEDGAVTRAWDKLDAPATPPALDAAVLQAARAELAADENAADPRKPSWWVPLSLAATVVIAIPILLQLTGGDGLGTPGSEQAGAPAALDEAATYEQLAQDRNAVDGPDADAAAKAARRLTRLNELAERADTEIKESALRTELESQPGARQVMPRAPALPPEPPGLPAYSQELPAIVAGKTGRVVAAAPPHAPEPQGEASRAPRPSAGLTRDFKTDSAAAKLSQAPAVAADAPAEITLEAPNASATAGELEARELARRGSAEEDARTDEELRSTATATRKTELAALLSETKRGRAGDDQSVRLRQYAGAPTAADLANAGAAGGALAARPAQETIDQETTDYAPPPAAARQRAADVEPPKPEFWLSSIERLHERGRTEKAKSELEDFRRHYPHYPLPEDFPLPDPGEPEEWPRAPER